ncbi:histone deacetylase [Peterkaempfera bronchialis]|uniref:Histone deacetylase n=1 Tax=Peterkaempfera bronchialis TaxID=2126346 RepID=A0A345SWI8_9ACTN|nr:histone deacetylase [Peterkaempfera bronchialis]AXI78093.1 histone deacetylase [Peterkaempfera bronchialis]
MTTPRRPERRGARAATAHHVWYAAYGSNMHLHRLLYYLAGGRPPDGARRYPGCRDTRRPGRMVPVMLPGRLYFAMESGAWTGGMAFHDPGDPGEMPARAYLVTAAQFSDIAAQEMYREPGADLELAGVLADGRAELGPGRYETLVCCGVLDGYPVLTFTAPWRSSEVEWRRPAAAYLRYLASGLVEAHGWEVGRVARYLSSRPGAAGRWRPEEVAALVPDLEAPVRPRAAREGPGRRVP